MLIQDEEVLFWNESQITFVLTNKRFLVDGIDIHKGVRKTGTRRHDYIFPIHIISTIHCTPIRKDFTPIKNFTVNCLTVEADGKTYTFNFKPGKDQFGKKIKQNKREIIKNIEHKFTEMHMQMKKHSNWVEKQKLEKILDKLMKRVDHIHKDEFMAVMGFSESKYFMDWFMNLPEGSPIILKGEIISFKSQVPPPAIKGTQKVQRKSFFCQLDNEQHPATESAYECGKCSRTVCSDCYDQSRDVGVAKCPYCNGDLHQVQ